jgi:hypothetical protein
VSGLEFFTNRIDFHAMGDSTDDGESVEPDPELPERDELIKAYIQYSEETRYRDGLMHNSYYFILIAIVLVAGQLVSAGPIERLLEAPRFYLAMLMLSVATAGIGVVINNYQRKRNDAENERKFLENVLDRKFTSTGLYADSHKSSDRLNDNPFTIDSRVVRGSDDGVEDLSHEFLSAGRFADITFYLGTVMAVMSLVMLVYTVIS